MKSLITNAIVAVLMLSGSAVADTIYVAQDGSGDYATIQEAVDASQDGDVIQLGSGTFIEPNIHIENKSISVVGAALNDNGTPSTTVSANGKGRVFTLQTSSGLLLKNMVIEGGASSNGGGCFNNGNATIEIVTLCNTASSEGGGLHAVSTLLP